MRTCKESLKEFISVNSLRLYWVPGHVEIEGNEKADELARKSSAAPGGESLNLLGRSVKPPMSEFKRKLILLKWNRIKF